MALFGQLKNARRPCLPDHGGMTNKTGLYRISQFRGIVGVMGDVFIHAEDLAKLS